VNRQTKRLLQRQGQVEADGSPALRRPPPPKARPREQRTTPMQFLREVRVELLKVNWPSGEEVRRYSAVVLFAVVVLVLFIFLLDYLFGHAISFLFRT
jgi:preprotein translocase subunit SecE